MTAPSGGWAGFALTLKGGAVLFGIGALVVFLLGTPVTRMIVAPLCDRLASLDLGPCIMTFAGAQDAAYIRLNQAALAGFILAVPCLVAQAARVLAPTLHAHAPRSVAVYAFAGGIIAFVAAFFVFFYEAPRAVAQAIVSFAQSMPDIAQLGLATNYVRAALNMAGSYVALLQIPLLLAMMVKSMRTRRIIDTEANP